ncbi:GNAT family N-acetyltransferase [Rhodococcus sp. NPDC056516]|uniref:GNAT family N-acetyltransferase n=1 Tax=Rhodococcus sp. NPDC056516 TaxID=3345847 RepID=UPI00366FCE63
MRMPRKSLFYNAVAGFRKQFPITAWTYPHSRRTFPRSSWIEESTVWTARRGGRLVGAVRGTADGTVWQIGRLMVAPDLAGKGLGRRLLQHVEQNAPAHITSFELFTGSRSVRNIRLYTRAGYVQLRTEPNHIPGVVYLSKPKVAVAD